jgi:tRNA dimethylallyltransferase
MSSNKKKVDFIVVTGPTATGKTKVAVNIASIYNGEIISADSRQIYKGMDIGTGKDLKEYCVNDKKISYHLIDILNPEENYSVYQFQRDFLSSYNQIKDRKNLPILCGGTGLYIESILLKYRLQNAPGPNQDLRESLNQKSTEELLEIFQNMSPEKYQDPSKKDTKNRIIRSIEIEMDKTTDKPDIFTNQNLDNYLVLGIKQERQDNRDLIKKRLIERLDEGLINEVENLINKGLDISRLDYFGLEYKFVGFYLKNELTKEDLIEKLHIAICQFAKRQMSWFRRMEKRGINIQWVSPNDKDAINNLIENAI